ncbi:peptidylprolyl isomerase [bacterium]|nr:peptidylprolyl isomerase [bacterium]|tara:strand:+ start:7893 stop:8417 length:525 start_codon:yes stop_codon:yes gene_type:complete
MKLSTFETVGIASSVALMAIVLWLVNLDATNQAISGLGSEASTAVVAGSDRDALTEALLEAGVGDGGVERLVIDDVVIGTGELVAEGDTVTVHYIGTLTDGTPFDNSYLRGTPFTVEVGKGRVIEGWDQGLIGMQVGGQRVLVIPPELGYGSAGGGPIPANSTLVFAIELLAIE